VTALVSYERAKAESLGLSAKGGLMERGERMFLLGVAFLSTVIFVPVLWLLLVLISFTAISRFVKVWNQASGRDAVIRRRIEAWREGRVDSRWRAWRESRETSGVPRGDIRRRGRVSVAVASMARPSTSAFITMPGPPPAGVSSTVRCLSVAKLRISTTSSDHAPEASALPARPRPGRRCPATCRSVPVRAFA